MAERESKPDKLTQSDPGPVPAKAPGRFAPVRSFAIELGQLKFIRTIGLSELAVQRLGEFVTERQFKMGDTLYEANSVLSALTILTGGACASFDLEGTQHASLTSGDIYGATALIEPLVAPTSFVALTDGRLLNFEAQAFEQFASEMPEAALKIQSLIARLTLQELKKTQGNLGRLRVQLGCRLRSPDSAEY